MLESDVIEPVMSDYNSPIVLVKKKDGTNRLCVDFRRINLVTKVSKSAKIRNRYNQVPHLTQDTNWKVTNSK